MVEGFSLGHLFDLACLVRLLQSLARNSPQATGHVFYSHHVAQITGMEV